MSPTSSGASHRRAVIGDTVVQAAYGPTAGAKRWCVTRAGKYFDDIAFGPGAMYVDGPDREVLSLTPDTGAERWRRSYDRGYEPTAVRANLVSGGGVAYAFVTHENIDAEPVGSLAEVLALRATDGAVLRRVTVDKGGSTGFRLMLAQGRLFLVGDDRLWAFAV